MLLQKIVTQAPPDQKCQTKKLRQMCIISMILLNTQELMKRRLWGGGKEVVS